MNEDQYLDSYVESLTEVPEYDDQEGYRELAQEAYDNYLMEKYGNSDDDLYDDDADF